MEKIKYVVVSNDERQFLSSMSKSGTGETGDVADAIDGKTLENAKLLSAYASQRDPRYSEGKVGKITTTFEIVKATEQE